MAEVGEMRFDRPKKDGWIVARFVFNFLAIFFGLVGLVTGLVHFFDSRICYGTASPMGIAAYHSFWGGCMYEIRGTLIPAKLVMPAIDDATQKIIFIPKPPIQFIIKTEK